MKAAYFNCIGGVSGDMGLGALVDVGLSIDSLRNELSKLGVQGYDIEASPDSRSAISGTRVSVKTSAAPKPRRNLNDILSLINESRLAPSMKEKATRIFPPTCPGRVPSPPRPDRSGPLPRGRRRRCHR